MRRRLAPAARARAGSPRHPGAAPDRSGRADRRPRRPRRAGAGGGDHGASGDVGARHGARRRPARALAAEITALPEMLALAMVHAAGRAARQEVLHELATSPSRTLAKESKRELQKLKQRGVQVQEIPPQGEPVLKPLPEGEAPSCYASSIDAYGERAVWWTRPARQGVEVGQVIMSRPEGVLAGEA